MNFDQDQKFESDCKQHIESADFLFTATDEAGRTSVEQAIRLVRHYAREYVVKHNDSNSTASAFQIVTRELQKSGQIVPIKIWQTETRQEILDFEAGKLTTFEFRRMCAADRSLRDSYERYTGLADIGTSKPATVMLTVQEYRAIPTQVAQRRYQTDPEFKKACDALFASGRV